MVPKTSRALEEGGDNQRKKLKTNSQGSQRFPKPVQLLKMKMTIGDVRKSEVPKTLEG